jgi:hypothetical protein
MWEITNEYGTMFWYKNLKGRYHLGDLGVDENIALTES